MQFPAGRQILVKPIQRLPSLTRRASNFVREAKAVVKTALSGEPLQVAEAERDRRKVICDACPFLMPKAYAGMDGCSHPECGCCMRAKRWFYAAKCPDRRW